MSKLRQPLVQGALEPARLYVQMELQRIFPVDAAAQKQLQQRIIELDPPGQSYRTWKMLIGLGSSFGLNWVPYFLSNDSFTWKLEELPLKSFVLTGMNPETNRFIIQESQQDPSALYDLWKQRDDVKQALQEAGVKPELAAGYLPLLACAYDDDRFPGRYRVFDGMHRLLAAVISNEPTVKAWVGRITNPNGRPFVSPELCYSLITIHTMSGRADPEFEQALKVMAEVLLDTYPNAGSVLELQVAGTKPDARIREVLGPVLQQHGFPLRN